MTTASLRAALAPDVTGEGVVLPASRGDGKPSPQGYA